MTVYNIKSLFSYWIIPQMYCNSLKSSNWEHSKTHFWVPIYFHYFNEIINVCQICLWQMYEHSYSGGKNIKS